MDQRRTVSRFRVPDLGVVVGYRIPHYRHILEHRPEMDWFEVISENFMVDGGSPAWWLDQLLGRYPVVQHGVSMSLGSDEDPDHTAKLRRLCDHTNTPWVSDHVCFTTAHGASGAQGINSHDLLPVPYNEDVLQHMADRCKRASDVFGRPFAVENPSSYLGWKASTMPEWAFVGELAERADVGILLDVNNIFVSSINHGFDPDEYLANLPTDRVVQIHLAGHTITDRGYRLDTHDAPVCDEVWALYRRAIERIGPVSTLIEWDDHFPTWDRLAEEAAAARRIRDEAVAVWEARVG